MKKNYLSATVLSILFLSPLSSNATSLTSNSVLNFNVAATGGNFASLEDVGPGSWFALEFSPGSQFVTGISGFDQLQIGVANPASSTSVGNIDNPWLFSSIPGVHQSLSPVNIISATGDTATIDFSGWGILWNDAPIDLSSGLSNGIATITCDAGSGCANGAGYVLDYFANADFGASGISNYSLHLEGTISAVPVPAAVWLFGSGLVGLVGIARRRR